MPAPRKPPVLMTPRLAVRMLDEGEAPLAARYYRANEEFHAPSSPRVPDGFYTEDFWRKRLRVSAEQFSADQGLRLFVIANQAGAPAPGEAVILGTVSFSQIFRGPFHAAKLGYNLAASAEGQGFMTEALRAAIDYAFIELNLHRIEAGYLTDNRRSAAVLARLDFTIEGTARDYLMINGRWRDHTLTARMNSAWRDLS